MSSNETTTNSPLTEALLLLARNMGGLAGNRTDGLNAVASTATATVIASNPEQTVYQSAQKLIGLRPGFTTDELMTALEQRFQPAQDEEGTDIFEYIPIAGSAAAPAPAKTCD